MKRLDIVADTYHSHSVKGTRGCEARVLFLTCHADMVITRDSKVWTKSDGPEELVPWLNHVHIEADNRMIAHITDMLRGDIEIKTICVRCYCHFSMLYDTEQWVIFGTGNNRRIISIN